MELERKLARLLDAVDAALRDNAQPATTVAEKYIAAMIARALRLVAREKEGGIDAPERALNAGLYGEESPSLDRLARDIRARALNDTNKPDLLALLTRYVDERVKRWNPDFLESIDPLPSPPHAGERDA